MRWHVETDFDKIDAGTVLTILATAYIPDTPPPQLAEGDEMSITFSLNDRSKATVVDASEDAIIIEMPDTSRWRVTRRTDADGPFGGPGTHGVPSEEWVVRDRV